MLLGRLPTNNLEEIALRAVERYDVIRLVSLHPQLMHVFFWRRKRIGSAQFVGYITTRFSGDVARKYLRIPARG